MKTAYEKSQAGQRAFSLPHEDEAFTSYAPLTSLCRKAHIPLPEMTELDITRHFSQLSSRTFGIDDAFYPLGSCTMKLNPRINEVCAQLPLFSRAHPFAPPETVQGHLHIIYELIQLLCTLTAMSDGTAAPNAGAQGELVGIQMIAAYHRCRNDSERTEILVPDNAHGTNPATAAMTGFTTVSIPAAPDGDLNIDALKKAVGPKTAGLMLTNPSTLGLFSSKILTISKIVHEAGGLLYYDGANLNAIMNIARPAEMGFDVMHINLHKTFSTPHGGGGPGSGPVLCNEKLAPFLPTPRIVKHKETYAIDHTSKQSIGRISSFYGNFATLLRAYLYCTLHGHSGLRRISEHAVLNANYLKKRLDKLFTVPFSQPCMHEFVVQADRFLDKKITAYDIAKRILDYGVHAPTVYFPLIIKECFLIEPTETESKQTLDRFVEILEKIVEEIENDPEKVRTAPHTLPVKRLDEAKAARSPCICMY